MELFGYREVLEQVIKYFGDKQTLTCTDVCKFARMDKETALKRYPILKETGRLPVSLFAKYLCGGNPRNRR